MTTALMERQTIDPALIERVVIHGDLRQLNPAQKVSYYKAVCESVGLNPLTQPFQYLVLNGKEILYATRAATEQLRNVHAVSVQITAREVMEDCYVVTARATLPSGRQDENIGAVPIAGLKGEARANAMMKAETKAKRRVTLAICGLGLLDETEVSSIPGISQDAGLARSLDRGGEAPSAAASSVATIDPRPSGSTPDPAPFIDTTTGEDVTPPPGYHVISSYSYGNGWHEMVILGLDGQGNGMTLSTKKNIGFIAQEAFADGIPVKVTWTNKPKGKDGGYLDTIEKYHAPVEPVGEPLDADSIPF